MLKPGIVDFHSNLNQEQISRSTTIHYLGVHMSQEIEEIRHFWKCLGNWENYGIAQAIEEIPGIWGKLMRFSFLSDRTNNNLYLNWQ